LNSKLSVTLLKDTKEGCLVPVIVAPRASKTRLIGIYDAHLKIAVASPPVDGKANDEIIRFLAKLFDVPRSAIFIKKGDTAKRKLLIILGYCAKSLGPALDVALANV